MLEGGALVVAHAGMKESYQGRSSARVRDFALYGETTGETDEFGLPVRGQWAADYRGRAGLGATIATLERAAARGLELDGLLDRERAAPSTSPAMRTPTVATCGPSTASPTCGSRRSTSSPPRPASSRTAITPHLERGDRLVAHDPDWIVRTDRRIVDVTDADSQAEAAAWWERLTQAGGEGMVVKPLAFTARGRKGLVQPGIKCRGREYLRIIYGPEYADPSQIDRLRGRGLGRERSLAVREFGLGVEALARFVRREPLYRVHECVFAVLALESEPVDPRL